jgi:acyl-CoA synthetase (AMP-forming)/AMP-acid ligase II
MSAIDYFERGVLLHKDQEALVSSEGSYTYRELQAASCRVAAAILAQGGREQSCLAVYSTNCIDIFPCLLGGIRAGKIIIPANALDEVEATAHFLNLTETRWLFYHSRMAENVARLKELVPSLKYFVCLDRDNGSDISLKRFMAEAPTDDLPDIPHDPHRTFYYYATGGTTGLSKAVIWDMLVWDTFVSLFNCAAATPEAPVHLCVAPISHTAGPLATALMAVGGKTVVMPGFDAPEVIKNIEKHRVTHIFLPPTALYAMLAHPEVGNFDYSSLRYFIVAAAPVAPEKIREAIKVFGPCLCQSYGQSEAPGFLTWMPPEIFAEAAADSSKSHLLKSCGRPTIGTKLAIMDDNGNFMAAGEAGEIVAQSNLVSVGYLNNPEATAEIRQFGWHHTGDQGRFDEDGFLWYAGRKAEKELIKPGGENVYPAEVEKVILENPVIEKTVVFGVPDPKWKEGIKAVCQLKEGETLEPQALIDFVGGRIARYKKPQYVEFVADLPVLEDGSPDRAKVKELYGGEQ